ncbi:TetR/AcrR family transcriptional regulator [Salinarimonas ramus]|uniref:TetR family transcriptional regulator n=1 Tax=Salinarimonas ramus TaxID=690164 RepID=A0A917V1J6_9HYPH|nr:TetR/AcrR family transcriptional regulator [Salinarimonas ramus]GGK20087.1 TetR family transcriptional regulator [Salinarimonas ramus]
MDHAIASTGAATRSLDPGKRRAILEGAQEVFLRDGFSATSMDEVARAAGVGKMTVYRHFGSKDALFRDMLREICGGTLVDAPTPPGATLEEELRSIGHAFVELITHPRRLGTYRVALSEAERTPDVSKLFYEGAVTPVVERVADRVAAHAPDLPAEEVRLLAGAYLQIVQGYAFMRLIMGMDREPDMAMFERQIALASEMIAARAAG